MSKQYHFEVVHNIPSPYRLHLFRSLRDYLVREGWTFHVHFMAETHSDRKHWKLTQGVDHGFAYTIWSDWKVVRRGKEWHLNPFLLVRGIIKRPTVLLVGGPWDSFTAPIMSLIAKRVCAIAWYESNTMNPGIVTGFSRRVKKLLLDQFDYFAVPGIEGQRHAQLIYGEKDVSARCLTLPNLIDEFRFTKNKPLSFEEKNQMKVRLGVSPGDRLCIWPARFIREKGISNFFKAIDPVVLKGWKIMIVGDGPLRGDVEAVLEQKLMKDSVLIKPTVLYDEMPSFYHAADLFLLPSLEDSNPLSVIEAMHSGLPVLVSRRIGNFPEVLDADNAVNGWAFDPFDHHEVSHVSRVAFATDIKCLEYMGRRSSERARLFWSTDKSIKTFLDPIMNRFCQQTV